MKRKTKTMASFFLTLIVGCSGLVGCDDSGSQLGGNGDVNVTLWSPPATQKIMRDREYTQKDTAALSYQMSRNETEGAQVIITPEQNYKVDTFTVATSDLKGPDGAVISKDAIKVYLQKYVRIDRQINHNQAYGAGYQPDPLLPFDIAVEYGENTVVGKNQGIYVTVETEKDTPAGVYVGDFHINIDGEIYNVPMSVEVWDFTITDEVHVRTLFDVWQKYLMEYELDSSDEMFDAYEEALLDYRLSAGRVNIPEERTRTLEDHIDAFIEEAIKLTKDARVTTIKMPTTHFEGTNAEKNSNRTQLLKEMAYASTQEVFLFDKLVMWFSTMIDEPQLSPSRHAIVNDVINAIDETKEEALRQLEDEGFFDTLDSAYAERIKEAIRKTPIILTGPYDETYIDGGPTYCPLFDEFSTEGNRDIYADQKEKNGSVWWYGCTGPCFPHPTYHIDDHLLGARVLSWMQYDYNIDGNLYWCVNDVDKYAPLESVWDAVKPDDMNGDGSLFYPGVDYGVYGPIGSLRLETIRDGMEDYEYLYQLEQEAKGLSEYYGETIEARDMLRSLFDRMYTNTYYDVDNYNFFAVRAEIADIMDRCKGESKFVLKKISYSGENATIKFNVANGYEVKVNGETITGLAQGQGKTYEVTIKLDKPENVFNITVENAAGYKAEYKLDAGKETRILTTFDQGADIEAVEGNGDTITVSHVPASAWGENVSAAKVEIVSTFDVNNPLATLTYQPEVAINVEKLNCNVEDLATLRLRIYNDSGIDIKVQFIMRTKFNQDLYFVKPITLKPGWNTISVEGIDKQNSSKLKDVTKFILQFYNTVNDENKEAMPKQTLYLDELLIAYTGKEESQ